MLRCFALVIGLTLAVAARADEPRVLTTIKPLQLIAAAALDGIAEPELLLPVGASPHSYALRPSERRALEQAQRVYWVGPELELFLEHLLKSRDTDVALMHAAGVTLRPLGSGHADEHAEEDHGHDEHEHQQHAHAEEHGHGHDHGGTYDAHIWLSPTNAVAIARAMAADLASLFPEHSDRLGANITRFEEQVMQLDSRLQKRFEPLAGKPYFVFHDGYGYLEDHYGLRARGIFSLSHEVQPGARHVAQLRERLQEAGPSCVFSEPQFTPRLIESLTAGLPVRSAALDPLGGDAPVTAQGYVEFLTTLSDDLAGCLESL
ncbi:zinc transport system substrate-binding protein [Halopseudomonas xinjiangensis]|uniref:High-affinity zinc uptake system protein ZnuA n=1 Tax=Halopseudomonas xinjiangensis TaxID=487184 RepID=A0A1H1Y585_9GAMM|nr:zinc ABC transporter substrate-binding protein ZnuA [Halopseudomonas xinjiangensis]SDT16610.1 zinc transport system substrate-binding protein [Halopseudomonas xinjiangensis]